MIKEALQYLIGLGNVEVKMIDEQLYSTQPVHRIAPPLPDPLHVRSLSGLIDYLHSEFDKQSPLLVHVASPTEVIVVSAYNRDFDRGQIVKATAMIPEFRYGSFLDIEDFNIKLQSGFVDFGDRASVLKLVGNIKEEAVNTVGDDGISQSVVAKTGVAAVSNVKVPNPVLLKPYRTFIEVDQPASDFIFRMQSGPRAALFEADGGAWKVEAMSTIKAFLEQQLEKQVIDGKITIIA